MKKIFIVFVAVLALLATGCGNTAAVKEPEAEIPQAVETEEPVQAPEMVELKAGGKIVEFEAESESIFLDSSELVESFVENKDKFTVLKTVEIDPDSMDVESIRLLADRLSGVELKYSVTIGGEEYDGNAAEVDLSGIAEPDINKISESLTKLVSLERVELMDADGNSAFTIDDAAAIGEACPGVKVNYTFELFGKVISTADETVEYEKVKIGDAGVEQIREILPAMSSLTYLKLDSCGTSDEVMAQLRDDFPDIKVVWRVWFSCDGYNCLTDTEKIWATSYCTDGYTEPLKYCTDVKYLDMGHNCITHIDFINYMPKLEVAVLSISWINDISPLANCPELEFLEIYSSSISDVSPLANCTKLKHLNLGNDVAVRDITPLYDLDLERFYFNNNALPQEQMDEYIRLHPDCETSFGRDHPVHSTWRFLPGYRWKSDLSETHYNERYALLREQIGYDTWDYSR